MLLHSLDCPGAVVHRRCRYPELGQHAQDHLGGDGVVFGDQNAVIPIHAAVLLGFLLVAISAVAGGRAALTPLVNQGCAQGVTGNRLAENAANAGIACNHAAGDLIDTGQHDDQQVIAQHSVILDAAGQLDAAHAGHGLIKQNDVERIAQVGLVAQRGECLATA